MLFGLGCFGGRRFCLFFRLFLRFFIKFLTFWDEWITPFLAYPVFQLCLWTCGRCQYYCHRFGAPHIEVPETTIQPGRVSSSACRISGSVASCPQSKPPGAILSFQIRISRFTDSYAWVPSINTMSG